MDAIFFINSFESMETFGRVAIKLKNDGINVKVLTVFKFIEKLGLDIGCDAECILDSVQNIKIPENFRQELAKLELSIGFSAMKILVSDLEHYNKDIDYSFGLILKYIYYWESLFKKKKYSFVISGLERIPYQTCMVVCKRLDIPYYLFDYAVIKDSYLFNQDLMGHHFPVDRYYEKNKDRDLTPDELERAKAYLYSERKKKFSHFIVKARPSVNLKKLRFFAEMFNNQLFVEKRKNPYISLRRGLGNYLKKGVRYYRAKSLYEKPDWNDKIVYFPIHSPGDAQLTIRAQQYMNQEYVVSLIANSIPADCTLYIKEHPLAPGDFPLQVLKRMKSYKNVKLIQPGHSSNEIIKYSSCVITINSTAGWEALLMNKPVISLGRAFYDITGLNIQVRDLYQLSDTIRAAANSESRDNEKVLLRFINALYEGVNIAKTIIYNLYYTEKGSNIDDYTNDENIQKVVDAVKRLV